MLPAHIYFSPKIFHCPWLVKYFLLKKKNPTMQCCVFDRLEKLCCLRTMSAEWEEQESRFGNVNVLFQDGCSTRLNMRKSAVFVALHVCSASLSEIRYKQAVVQLLFHLLLWFCWCSNLILCIVDVSASDGRCAAMLKSPIASTHWGTACFYYVNTVLPQSLRLSSSSSWQAWGHVSVFLLTDHNLCAHPFGPALHARPYEVKSRKYWTRFMFTE